MDRGCNCTKMQYSQSKLTALTFKAKLVLHESPQFNWLLLEVPTGVRQRQSTKQPRAGTRPKAQREPRALGGLDELFVMKNELIKERAGIYIINYIAGGVSRVINQPLCTNTENLLAKLQPHCFCALTLCSIHQKCGSFDFWCNHFDRERNNEDEPQCCNMMRTSTPSVQHLLTTWLGKNTHR